MPNDDWKAAPKLAMRDIKDRASETMMADLDFGEGVPSLQQLLGTEPPALPPLNLGVPAAPAAPALNIPAPALKLPGM